jgi:hypothetical protein
MRTIAEQIDKLFRSQRRYIYEYAPNIHGLANNLVAAEHRNSIPRIPTGPLDLDN